MTSYTWRPTANGEFSDPGNWVQGAAPGPADTAVVDTSALPPSSSTKVATLLTDETLSVASLTYRYTWNSQGVASIASAFLTDSTIAPGTTLAVTSTNPNPNATTLSLVSGFDLSLFGAVSNAGTIAIGSPGDGHGTKVTSTLYNSLTPDANHNYNAGAFSNSGLISVGYGSLYNLTSSISKVQFANTGTIAVSDGATFIVGAPNIGVGVFTGSQGFSDDGVVSVLGAAGTVTQADFNLPVFGSGTFIADGGTNANNAQTGVVFGNNVSGVNLELQNHAEAQYNFIINSTYAGGSVTFEDDTSLLSTRASSAGPSPVPPIYGFRAGDSLGLFLDAGGLEVANTTGLAWNQASHSLDVMSGTNIVYAYTLMGTYGQGDFSFLYGASGTVITTTSTANAAVTRSTTSSGQVVLSTATGGLITTAAGGSTQVNLGAAYSSVTSQGSDAITAGAGQASVVASGAATTVTGGSGRLSFQGGAGSAVVSTGPGGSAVTTGTGSSQVFLGAGSDVVNAHGQDLVAASSGADTVYAASAVLAYGGASGQLTVVSGAAASTVVGGGGDATVYGSTGGGGVVYGGSGATEFVGGAGASTFVGGGGPALVYGGAGGGAIFGGPGGGQFFGASAATVIEVGTGASTVTASDGNVVFLVGAAPDLVVAGAGNVTLAGAASSGSNSFFAGFGADQISGGSGNDSFVAGTGRATLSGGGGSNVFGFVNGRAGGSDVITDFRSGVDHLSLQGYAAGAAGAALSRASVSGGASTLTLGDGTQVTLQGVTRLGVADFV